jgi:mannose/fructose/N-acetylgalactosamine-specific phosphotransferase system component IID
LIDRLVTVFYFDFMEESAQRTVLMNGASWRVFLRSFFIEIMWNYPRMQNIGFTFCSLPAVDRLTGAKDVRLDITRRLLESANTNPVFGPMCLGAMARIESFPERLPTAGLIKKRLMSTLAAQGDRIFWGVIRPLASFFAVIVSLTSAPAWLVPIVALSIYNIPNVVTRFIGFDMGWREGIDVARRFKSWRFESYVGILRGLVFFCAGTLAGASTLYCVKYSGFHACGHVLGILAFVIVVFSVCFFVLRKSFSQTLLIYPILIITILAFSFLKEWT